jgi:hypothetical protein
MEDYYYTPSGAISGSLDALSAEFSGYEPLPLRERHQGNVLYRARRFGRYYVLKGLVPELRDAPASREYLSKEYQIGVQLDHPNIVRVNSLEEDPKAGLCIVMHPNGKRFPVTLDTGQTVYARVLSHWHRTVALVSPSDAMTWNDIPNAPSGDMVIPADIRHRGLRYRVVGVDSCAFHNCNKLTHVTFPEGLERIGFRAFSGCIMIQDTITIPKSLRNIEPFAFADCNSITTLVWKSSPCHIGNILDTEWAFFYRCSSLKKAVVDECVDSLAENVFTDKNWLEEIVLPGFSLVRSLLTTR